MIKYNYLKNLYCTILFEKKKKSHFLDHAFVVFNFENLLYNFNIKLKFKSNSKIFIKILIKNEWIN